MRKKKNKALAALPVSLPCGWDALTGEQVARVVYFRSLNLPQTEYLVRLAAEFADLKPRGSRVAESGEIRYLFYHRSKGNVVLSSSHVASLAYALKWTMEEPELMEAPPIDGCRTPDSQINEVSLERFITADTAFGAYLRQKDVGALRILVATLYLRKDFDPDRLEKEAERLKYIPLWRLEAVFLWWIGVKKMLCKKYPFVFSKDDSPGPVTPGDEILMGILSSLNDGRVADNERIKRIDVHEALYELNLQIKRSKK